VNARNYPSETLGEGRHGSEARQSKALRRSEVLLAIILGVLSAGGVYWYLSAQHATSPTVEPAPYSNLFILR
jgi:hypothetical protein